MGLVMTVVKPTVWACCSVPVSVFTVIGTRMVKRSDILSARWVQENEQIQARLYPNPAAGEVRISCNVQLFDNNVKQNQGVQQANVDLLDVYGRVLKSCTMYGVNTMTHSGFEANMNLSAVSPGQYYVRIKVGKALKTLAIKAATLASEWS